MSYPKRHPAVQASTDRDVKQTQRKEQLKNLLITKFRGKYGVNAPSENDQIDVTIRNEVETFLMTEQMTEQNLVKLDKKLTEMLKGKYSSQSRQQRQNSIGATQRIHNLNKDNDYGMNQSMRSSVHSRKSDASSSQRQQSNQSIRSRSSVMKDVGSRIMNNSQNNIDANNATGSEDYWNKIIKFNVDQFHKEQEEAKQRVRDNQQRMKEELERQVQESKKVKELEKRKELDYVKQVQERGQIESQKEQLKHEEMKRKLQQEKQVRDMQLRENQTKKDEELRLEKQQEEERRARVEMESKLQQQKEMMKQKQMREFANRQKQENEQMKEITKQQYGSLNTSAVGMPGNGDMFDQIFAQKKNISLEKGKIAEKKIELIKDQIVGDQAQRNAKIDRTIERVQKEQESYLAKLEEQKKKELKQKEIETKRYLDLQMQEKKAKDGLHKVQDNMDARFINSDVKAFEEQERKKREELDRIMRDHQNSLQQQMQKPKQKNAAMAQHEFMLNKQIIENIESQNQGSPGAIHRKPF
eukprot:403341038